MGQDKKLLIESLNTRIKELQQEINMHCCLVTSVLEEKLDAVSLADFSRLCPKRERELRLQEAVKETIEVLEESRKSFKSKRLGELRKKLTRILVEEEGPSIKSDLPGHPSRQQ